MSVEYFIPKHLGGDFLSKVKVALLQLDIQLGKPEQNREKVLRQITTAVDQGAQIITLPELWTTGYALQDLKELAPETEVTLESLQQVANSKKIWIFAGSMLEQVQQKFFNTTFVINDSGQIVGKYRKTHLFSLMNEDQYFSAGDEICVVETPFGKVGTVICYDLRFPELIRQIAILGAIITVVAAEWPHPRLAHWRILNQARAIENQSFILAVNRTGVSKNTHFCGNSMIIDPWGEILAEANEAEEILIAELDLTQVTKVRNTIPCWSDRRIDLYS